MLLSIRPRIFLNELTFEINELEKCLLKVVLRDEGGRVCTAMEASSSGCQSVHTWKGLNDLPYGVYTFEVSGGSEEVKTQLVKRI